MIYEKSIGTTEIVEPVIEPSVRVEITTSAKGVPQPSVRVVGDNPHAVYSQAIELYKDLRRHCALIAQLD